MYDMIVKQWDMVLKEEAVGQFCTKFHESRWLWINPETSLCETYVILGRSFIKMIEFMKYAPKCQLGITNLADEIINM